MEYKWEEAIRFPLKDNQRIRTKEGFVIIEEKVEEKDVTSTCIATLVPSGYANGYYVSIYHNGKSIGILGVNDASYCELKKGYRMEKAEEEAIRFPLGARVSFRILKTG